MDTLLRFGLLAVVVGCTPLESGDELRDGGPMDSGPDVPDAFDASPDTFDACADPAIGECPPVCMRERVIAGRVLDGVGRRVPRDETWHCGVIWELREDTYVHGSELTIEAGTVIEAWPGVSLIIEDGSRLVVDGTRDAPVVIRRETVTDYMSREEWRGLYLLGHASVLDGGGDPTRRDVSGLHSEHSQYGAETDADDAYDCGSLSHLRLEFGGQVGGNDVAALFLGGCGSETTLDFVQVHESAEDGIEIHGGGFDLRHIIVTNPDEDALQWERGWNGTVQYFIGYMPLASDKQVLKASGPIDGVVPLSNGIVANMTGVASSARSTELMFVDGSALLVGNSIAIYRELFLSVDPSQRIDDVEVRNSVLDSVSFADDEETGRTYFEPSALDGLYAPPNNGNDDDDPDLVDGVGILGVSPRSWRSSRAALPGDLPAGLDATDYVGAIDPDPDVEEWTEGWTSYARPGS